MINTLVLSSGGVLGIAHVGVIKYLQYKNILSNIKCFSGCSVGSLICYYHILGYSPEDMLVDSQNFKIFPSSLTLETTEQIVVNTLTHANILDNKILIEHLEKNNKLFHILIPNAFGYSSLLKEFRKYFVYINNLKNKLEARI